MPQSISEALPSAPFDFAVAGSTALAALLSLLLAEAGHSVLRLTHRRAGQRLPQGIDLGLPISARHETWSVFATGARETGALLNWLGLPSHLEHTNVRVETLTAPWMDGLGHLVHLARANGVSGEVMRHTDGHAFVFHRIVRLDSATLERALAMPLERLHVRTLDLDTIERIEGENIWVNGGTAPLETKRLVLVDGASINRFGPPELWSHLLRSEPVSIDLLSVGSALPEQIVITPEASVVLLQSSRGQVLSFTEGEHEADARLASRLPGPFPIKRLASRRSRQLFSRDGAPVLQLTHSSTVSVIGGLGSASAFFAPSLTRLLLGTASSLESAWLEAHSGPSRHSDLASLLQEIA